MEIKRIEKNNKIITYIYFCLDYEKPVSSKDKFISFLIKDIVKSPVGYAGLKLKNLFKAILLMLCLDGKRYHGNP